ncbi:predicted protein [Pyrenophora tritici-repentis Pt-1C-BFP]|uniref:BTB domain-containing protein n=1 Tax=Pyrenophora tritici-repentis (strain Pt-1C-BFP) TaxID=426418 RepID=B2VZS7_PYRTR|nr:uncharacterized protein PTRG_02917 [Pyrenophora tritici-repentis Pt-1C-BFP]EDU45440.1 predicted protein [Pyrenophora tritici-repentis Pt-1C-BFP]
MNRKVIRQMTSTLVVPAIHAAICKVKLDEERWKAATSDISIQVFGECGEDTNIIKLEREPENTRFQRILLYKGICEKETGGSLGDAKLGVYSSFLFAGSDRFKKLLYPEGLQSCLEASEKEFSKHLIHSITVDRMVKFMYTGSYQLDHDDKVTTVHHATQFPNDKTKGSLYIDLRNPVYLHSKVYQLGVMQYQTLLMTATLRWWKSCFAIARSYRKI